MYLSTVYILILTLVAATWHMIRLLADHRTRRHLARQHGCLAPPSLPRSSFLFGIDTLLAEYRNFRSNTYLSMLVDRFNTSGTTWSCHTLGATNFATIDLENIKHILVTNSQDFGLGRTRSTVLGTTLDHGIFTAQGDEWRWLRRITRPGFAAAHVRAHIEEHVRSLLHAIASNADNVDLQPLFHNLTLHNAASVFWGADALRQLDEKPKLEVGEQTLAQRMNAAIAAAFAHTQDVMVLGPLARLPVFQSSSNKEAIELVYHFILDNCRITAGKLQRQQQGCKDEAPSTDDEDEESADADTGAAGIFLDQDKSNKNALPFDPAHIQLRQMFMAAEGTTAETLTHLFHLLSRHPRALGRLRAEIAKTLALPSGEALPTPSDLNNMPYLEACVKETLRLFPTVPFNNRIALHDTVLPRGGGADGLSPIVVPAGSEISLPHYPLYRRRDIFGEDADEFVPARWIDQDDGPESDQEAARIKQKQCEAYLPFSIGKRACPGRQIALETVRYVAVRLVQEFPGIEDASENRPWQENCGATLQSRFGAVQKLKPPPSLSQPPLPIPLLANSTVTWCGENLTTALSSNCKFDLLFKAWMPTACIDTATKTEYMVHDTGDAWHAFADLNHTQPSALKIQEPYQQDGTAPPRTTTSSLRDAVEEAVQGVR
ncbi:cytochrome P450 [Aspergillus multicolor]|uniref:cytochrome P450 n=1 Tax=Aspergillus multicolor TaxID=41759 RepID=UPI003CCDEE89